MDRLRRIRLDSGPTSWRRRLVVVMATALITSACTASPGDEALAGDAARTTVSSTPAVQSRLDEALALADPGSVVDYGVSPPIPSGALSPELRAAVEALAGDDFDGSIRAEEIEALEVIAESVDVRLAWVISDVLRLAGDVGIVIRLNGVAEQLLDRDFPDTTSWAEINNHLLAWEVPAPPGYLEAKANVFTAVVPQWDAFFQPETEIDWRMVSWGGVGIDDRPFGSTEVCNCIAAVDTPTVTDAEGASWLDEDDVVFGVVIDGETRAYPRQVMEVREMVNDTLGGRHFGLPYCTLCGSAQLFFTDNVSPEGERPVLRTSGLLNRSNKVMFDVNTFSLFDTFTGAAVSGPLLDRGVVLDQHGVVTTTWGQWRSTHPDTTVLTEDLALGRKPDFRSNRDADGPIFPVGTVDERLAVQADVVGVVSNSGRPVAFHVDAATAVIAAGAPVVIEIPGGTGADRLVELVADGGGLRAVDGDGEDLASHQAFWFAWSQFHPDTLLWPDHS